MTLEPSPNDYSSLIFVFCPVPFNDNIQHWLLKKMNVLSLLTNAGILYNVRIPAMRKIGRYTYEFIMRNRYTKTIL